MRRFVLLAVVGATLATVPVTGHARIRDGKECNESGSNAVWTDQGSVDEPGKVENAERGSYCVRANDMTLFYIGGEAMPEDPDNRGFSGLCGSLIIADDTSGSGHPNANPDDDNDWDYDHKHPGPDGKLDTPDDEIHHHDCN